MASMEHLELVVWRTEERGGEIWVMACEDHPAPWGGMYWDETQPYVYHMHNYAPAMILLYHVRQGAEEMDAHALDAYIEANGLRSDAMVIDLAGQLVSNVATLPQGYTKAHPIPSK